MAQLWDICYCHLQIRGIQQIDIVEREREPSGKVGWYSCSSWQQSWNKSQCNYHNRGQNQNRCCYHKPISRPVKMTIWFSCVYVYCQLLLLLLLAAVFLTIICQVKKNTNFTRAYLGLSSHTAIPISLSLSLCKRIDCGAIVYLFFTSPQIHSGILLAWGRVVNSPVCSFLWVIFF